MNTTDFSVAHLVNSSTLFPGILSPFRRLRNSDVYEGEMKDGKRNGQSTMNFGKNDSAVRKECKGQWKDDELYGQGKMIWANGDVYEGEWKKRKPDGQGKMTFNTSDVLEGKWSCGNFEQMKKFNGTGFVPIDEL